MRCSGATAPTRPATGRESRTADTSGRKTWETWACSPNGESNETPVLLAHYTRMRCARSDDRFSGPFASGLLRTTFHFLDEPAQFVGHGGLHPGRVILRDHH